MRLPPRWVVAVSFAVAAAILGDSLLYAVLPATYDDLGLQAAMVGVLLSANRFVRLASNPVAGWVFGRAGVRGPFLAAVFLAALTTASYGLGLGFAVFLLGRIGWGICWSFLRLGGYLAALDSSDGTNRGFYLGFFNGVTRFGSFVAALLGGFMTDLIGFRETVFAFTTVTIIGGLAVLRERPPDISPATISSAGARRVSRAGKSFLKAMSGADRRRLWAVYAAVLIQAMTVQGLVTATLGSWLQDNYGDDIRLIALTVGAASLTGMLLSSLFLSEFLWGPFSGHLSDRHGRNRFLVVAGVCEVITLLGLALAAGVWWTIVVALGLFLAATAIRVTLDALAGDLAPPEHRSQVMSWYATFSDLGSAAGPLVGWVVGVGIGLGWMYAGSAAAVAAVGTMYTLVSQRNPSTFPSGAEADLKPGD